MGKFKEWLWYSFEAAAITGLAIFASMLSVHVQYIGNTLCTVQLCWQQKCALISSYWNESEVGIFVELGLVFIFVLLYLVVRGHADKGMKEDVHQILIELRKRNNSNSQQQSDDVNKG